jgi:hypothetical protein
LDDAISLSALNLTQRLVFDLSWHAAGFVLLFLSSVIEGCGSREILLPWYLLYEPLSGLGLGCAAAGLRVADHVLSCF